MLFINNIFLIFPAFIASLDKNFGIYVDPFEVGPYAFPVLVTNVIIFYFLYLHYTKKLPNAFRNSVKFILKFEISRKVAAIVIIILLGGYIGFTAEELSLDESSEWDDFRTIQNTLIDFPFNQFEKSPISPWVKYFLLYSSQTVFQNIKIVPFLGTISLLLVTYFLTLEISKKRFAGIIAMIILLQSNIFLRYDTVATYSNFWTLFFVLSLYMTYKRWYLSPVSYFLSVFGKVFSILFFPMVLFFTYRANIPREKKIRIGLTYIIIAAILAGIIIASSATNETNYIVKKFDDLRSFNYVDFVTGFSAWAIHFRFDVFILLFSVPVTVGLFLVSRKGIPEADSILVIMLGILILAPLLPAFTTYNAQPYRLIPLIVFFAIGVGTLLSKKITQSAL